MASLMDAAADLARANKIEPLTNEYDETKGVAGRVASISASGSPLMQRAATTGLQQAAARGLTNSTLGIQASQNAVLDHATPIATADAQLFGQNSLANLAAKNSAATTNAQLGVNSGIAGLNAENAKEMQGTALAQQQSQFTTQAQQAQQQIDNQVDQFAKSLGMTTADLQLRRDSLTQQQQQYLSSLDLQRAQLSQQNTQFTASQAQAAQQAGLTRQTQVEIASIEAAYKKDLQGNVNLQNAWGQLQTNIATIQNNPNLELSTKNTLIANNLAAFRAFADFWKTANGGTIDVSALLNFNQAGASGTVPVIDQNPTTGPVNNPYAPPLKPEYTGGGA